MNTYKLSNIPISVFREYLKYSGCTFVGTEGGHEKWFKAGSLRPVIIQTHIDPIPEFIIRNNLRVIGKTRKDFIEWQRNRK